MVDNLYLVYEDYEKVYKWKYLLTKLDLNINQFGIITKSKRANNNQFLKINTIITNQSFINNLRNFFKVVFLKNENINYLSDHPELNIGIKKMIPKFFKKIYVKYLYYNIKFKLLDKSINNIHLMEPKNFLYSIYIILIEIISIENKINISFIHATYLLKNIRFFNNLTRKDHNLENIFIKQNLESFNNDFQKLNDKKFEFLKKKKIKKNFKLTNINNLKKKLSQLDHTKTVVISLPKENNSREFYFTEKSLFHNLPAIIKIFKESNFNVILKKHPLSSVDYNRKFNLIISDMSLKDLSNLTRIDLHFSSSSHTFFDAIMLDIPIMIFSKKDLYSLRSMIPEVFIDDINKIKDFICKNNTDQIYKFNRLKSSLQYLIKTKKAIEFEYLSQKDQTISLSNNIISYFK